ncbi:HAD-IIB family hydrolase [Vibrio sp. 10N.261.51.F12]|uniref:HAD family hydrolase n=1 Tax=Vibrio sp. 10N.261.51.F12 TaxID=3229679 RepID=UPI00354F083D
MPSSRQPNPSFLGGPNQRDSQRRLDNPKPLDSVSLDTLKNIQWLLTDVDDTLTWEGTLPPETLHALTQLKAVGVHVVAVTGACAGWCDQIAKLWPIHGVIGENGAFYMQKNTTGFHTQSALPLSTMKRQQTRLLEQLQTLLDEYPDIQFADDQTFRYCDVAINIGQDRAPVDATICQRLLEHIRTLMIDGQQVKATQSSIHINVWLGEHSKRVSSETYLIDNQISNHIGTSSVQGLEDTPNRDLALSLDQVTYIGDSLNDESMFAWLPTTFGVNNISRWLPQLSDKPSYITKDNGGYGFAELANRIVDAKRIDRCTGHD